MLPSDFSVNINKARRQCGAGAARLSGPTFVFSIRQIQPLSISLCDSLRPYRSISLGVFSVSWYRIRASSLQTWSPHFSFGRRRSSAAIAPVSNRLRRFRPARPPGLTVVTTERGGAAQRVSVLEQAGTPSAARYHCAGIMVVLHHHRSLPTVVVSGGAGGKRRRSVRHGRACAELLTAAEPLSIAR